MTDFKALLIEQDANGNACHRLTSMTAAQLDAGEVTLRVRISKSGQAQAQPGDLGVSLSPVKPGAQGLNLTVREALR